MTYKRLDNPEPPTQVLGKWIVAMFACFVGSAFGLALSARRWPRPTRLLVLAGMMVWSSLLIFIAFRSARRKFLATVLAVDDFGMELIFSESRQRIEYGQVQALTIRGGDGQGPLSMVVRASGRVIAIADFEKMHEVVSSVERRVDASLIRRLPAATGLTSFLGLLGMIGGAIVGLVLLFVILVAGRLCGLKIDMTFAVLMVLFGVYELYFAGPSVAKRSQGAAGGMLIFGLLDLGLRLLSRL